MLTVQVLVQAVIIIGPILEQQGRRPALAGLMTALKEVRVLLRIAHLKTHRDVPAIGDGDQQRGHCRAEVGHKRRQRIAEILVLSTPKTMSTHLGAAAEERLLRIESHHPLAFVWSEKAVEPRAALRVEFVRHTLP